MKVKPKEPRETRRTGNEFLSQHGGLVVAGTGIALIVLAAKYSDRAEVAPIFAFTGIAAVILGVLLPRLTGETELSLNRIKFVLMGAKDALGAGRLTPEEVSNLYEGLLLRIDALASGREARSDPCRGAPPTGSPTQAEPETGVNSLTPSKPPVVPFSELTLLGVFKDFLVRNHWSVEETPTSDDGGWDIQAVRASERLMVQAKAAMQIGAVDIATIAVLLDAFTLDIPHGVLVVPDGAMSAFARRQATAVSNVMSVYGVSSDGDVYLISGPEVVRL